MKIHPDGGVDMGVAFLSKIPFGLTLKMQLKVQICHQDAFNITL